MVVAYFIYSSVDGDLSSFHFLAFTNNAAMTIHIQVSVWAYVFSWGIYPRVYTLFLKIIFF